jgi:hypothetical protein
MFKKEGNLNNIIKKEMEKNISGKQKYTVSTKRISENLYTIRMSTKDESFYLKIKKTIEEYNELLPPWIAFPDMFQGTPRWNQGYEQDYCWTYWIPYWKKMSGEEKTTYYAKHNAPKEWIDWLQEHTITD